MSLFAVKNDKGEWLNISGMSTIWHENAGDFCAEPNATILAHRYHGHVVELVEKPAPIVVSEDEAEMLERAKDSCWPAHIFDCGAAGATINSQDRLMRAYVNGYAVAKEKRYLVYKLLSGKIASDADDAIQATRSILSDNAVGWEFWDRDYLRDDDKYRFTDAEIEHYGLQDCEKAEVPND